MMTIFLSSVFIFSPPKKHSPAPSFGPRRRALHPFVQRERDVFLVLVFFPSCAGFCRESSLFCQRIVVVVIVIVIIIILFSKNFNDFEH